jgi:hypothetical protein
MVFKSYAARNWISIIPIWLALPIFGVILIKSETKEVNTLKLTNLLRFSGLILLIIGLALILNTFVTPTKLTGNTSLLFTQDHPLNIAAARPLYLGKGDELTVIVDPNYPAINHYITLTKAGSNWTAEQILEGQGAWSVKAPTRGVYTLIVEGTVVGEAPEGTTLRSSITWNVKSIPRIDSLEPTLYGAMIPGLALIVASIYLGGKKP